MKLLFIYFYEKKGSFKDGTLIQFSKKYNVDNFEIVNQKNDFNFYLSLNQQYQDNFYSSNCDMSVLIGENGTGKSILINSIRDKKNDYSIVIYENRGKFFFLNHVHKNIHLKIEDKIEKANKIDDNFEYIYYSSILDTSDNDIKSDYNISNRALLKKYDDLSLDNRLSLIENDDIHKYINFSKNSKLDYVKIEKLKLYPSKTYFDEVKDELIKKYSEVLLDTFFNIINNEKDENILKFIISKFDKEKIEEIYSYLLDNNDRFYVLLLSNDNLLNKQYKKTLENLNKSKFNALLINEIIEELNFDLEKYIIEFFENRISKIELIDITFENNPNNFLIHKFEELLNEVFSRLNIDYIESQYKLNNIFIEQLKNNIYYKISIKYIIFDKIYNEIVNKILSIYLNLNVNSEDERRLLRGIQKIQKISLIKHLKENSINTKNKISEKTFMEELFIESFKVGFIFIRDFMYIFNIETNRVELFNNYLFKYINKIIRDIDEIGLMKLLFILSFYEYSRNLNDFDKVRLQSSLNILMNLDIEFYKFKKYKINFDLEPAELLINLDDYFEIFDIGEKLNILKESIKIENNDLITEISNEFFDSYESIIKNSIKPFIYEVFPSLSSGQKAILFIFARINDAIQKINEEKRNQNIILLLDEADLKLHLEWQRKFVHDLIEFLNSYINNKFYILYATHSPMILSDITDNRVVFLQKDGEFSNDVSKNVIPKKRTFGANIYDLYHDSFFMEQFMGEFAQNKINQIIDIINLYKIIEEYERVIQNNKYFMKEIRVFINKYDLFKIINSFRRRYLNEKVIEQKDWKQYILSTIRQINRDKVYLQNIKNKILKDKDNLFNTIESIGEPLLRNQLLDEVKNIGITDRIDEIINKLKNLSHEEIEQELNKYDREKQIELWKNLFKIKENNND